MSSSSRADGAGPGNDPEMNLDAARAAIKAALDLLPPGHPARAQLALVLVDLTESRPLGDPGRSIAQAAAEAMKRRKSW